MPRSKLIFALIAAALGTAVAVSLGNWQTRRADEKLRLQAQADAAMRAAPFEIVGSRSALEDAASSLPRKVRVSGVFDPTGTVYLDNRLLEGIAGYYVITPLVIGEGMPAVLIDRGWKARNAGPPATATPAGRISLEGIAVAHPSALLQLGRMERQVPGWWQNLDYDDYEQAAKRSVARFVVRQTTGDDAAADGLRRVWPQPASGIARHRGYAFQWYALAGLIATLGVYFGWRAKSAR